MGEVLRVKGLCKSYPGFELKNVNFDLKSGYVMGFIGQNGAGKTTTIKLIMNLIRKDSGTVEVFGREMTDEEAALKERIGFVYDEHVFYGFITVAEMARIVAPFYRNWSNVEFSRLARDFGLDVKRKIDELSRGQKTKLALAIALSHDAELLIMDEPTSGLDPVFRSELIDILYRVIQDKKRSIFFSTHITTDLEKIADFVTFIDAGRIVFSQSKDALLERYRIVRGPMQNLSARVRGLCTGIRETKTGFEALTESANDIVSLVGNNAISEKATLEEIMVYFVKGAVHA